MSRYIELYEKVREDIVSGRYPYGTKLPSKRNMAEESSVSVITVQHAYEMLADEGYIRTEEKSGYYVSFMADDIFPVADHYLYEKKKEAVSENLSHGNTGDMLSFQTYARIMRKVMTTYGEELMERSRGFGCDRLRNAISGYLARSRKIYVTPEQIIIGAGAEYLYGVVVKTLGRELRYGVESPSYKKIAQVYEAEGADLSYLKLGNDGILSEELWNSDIGVLHISPYRSFPSGVTASVNKKREYLKWRAERSAVIIEDDFESEFSPSRKPEETVFAMGNGENVIYINTFSKTIGSYLRTAYMVVPKSMTELFTEKTGFYTCTVPTPTQYLIAELIEDGEFERHINRVRRKRKGLVR